MAGTLGGGTCIDCDDDRRKKGIDDGVSRFVDGLRRTEPDGLRGPLCGRGGTFVLALDAVSVRLATRRSGVFEVVIDGGREALGEAGARAEPIEDKEAKEVAEAIASEWTGDQPSVDRLGAGDDNGFSFDIDFRICCPNDIVRGLTGMPGDFGAAASRIDDVDGVDDNFLPSALEKLHFLEGVLWMFVGVVDFGTCSELCLDGVVGNGGTSRVEGKVTSLKVSLLLRSGTTSPCSVGRARPGDARGDLNVESSFGSGGTGGT